MCLTKHDESRGESSTDIIKEGMKKVVNAYAEIFQSVLTEDFLAFLKAAFTGMYYNLLTHTKGLHTNMNTVHCSLDRDLNPWN